MGCGGSSEQIQNVSNPKKMTLESQEIIPAQPLPTKQPIVNKKGQLPAITTQNEKLSFVANTAKQTKVFNPLDLHEGTQKRQAPSRETKSRSKGRVGAKSSHRHRQPTSQTQMENVESTEVTSRGQLVPQATNRKIVVSPSKVSIKITESQHQEHTTAQDQTLSRNDMQGRYDKQNKQGKLDIQITNQYSQIVPSRINETTYKEIDHEKKKKNLRQSQSKKKSHVDPKLNALIQIYGFE